jgi:hypothetical protein
MIKVFFDFRQFWAEKIGAFLKQQCCQILQMLAVV